MQRQADLKLDTCNLPMAPPGRNTIDCKAAAFIHREFKMIPFHPLQLHDTHCGTTMHFKGMHEPFTRSCMHSRKHPTLARIDTSTDIPIS